MADEVSTRVRSTVERALEADVADRIARRGRELAGAVSEATEAVSARAAEAWRDSEPQRRDAEKTVRRAGKDAMGWSRRTWKRDLFPALNRLWDRRTVAIGAAGAAVPAGRELVEDAAVRLGIRQRSEGRHWLAFFIGLLVGAAAGAAIAMLTTPKPGRAMRDELAVKARTAAGGAGEWVPIFQREGANGSAEEPITTTAATPGDVQDTEPIAFEEPISESAASEGDEHH